MALVEARSSLLCGVDSPTRGVGVYEPETRYEKKDLL